MIHVQISVPKRKSGKKNSGLQNGVIRGLQIGAGFRDYKIGVGGITNRGSFRDIKLGQKDNKSVQRDFKSGRNYKLQTNLCQASVMQSVPNFSRNE